MRQCERLRVTGQRHARHQNNIQRGFPAVSPRYQQAPSRPCASRFAASKPPPSFRGGRSSRNRSQGDNGQRGLATDRQRISTDGDCADVGGVAIGDGDRFELGLGAWSESIAAVTESPPQQISYWSW